MLACTLGLVSHPELITKSSVVWFSAIKSAESILVFAADFYEFFVINSED